MIPNPSHPSAGREAQAPGQGPRRVGRPSAGRRLPRIARPSAGRRLPGIGRLSAGRRFRRVGRVFAGPATLFALLLALPLALASCSDSADDLLLQPGGEDGGGGVGSGTVRGILSFDGTVGGTEARVFALRSYDSGCATPYSSIHLTGNYTDPEWDASQWAVTPGMRSLGGCLWYEAVTLEAGLLDCKLVTDQAWDTPPDFGGNGTAQGLTGDLFPSAPGSPNLQINIPASGTYALFLNESTDPATYRMMPESEAPIATVDPATGVFVLEELGSGTYELVVVAEGFLDFHISGVVLEPDGSVDLGQRDVSSASGEIRGSVVFPGSPDPLPIADVSARTEAGTIAATVQTNEAGVFVFTGLGDGTYDIEVSAEGYLTATREGVVFANGDFIALDPITLEPGCEPLSEIVQVLGDFNKWDESAPAMTQLESCLFVDTLQVAVTGGGQTHFMKFRTGNNWNSPEDYGTCTTEADTLFGAGAVCPAANGPALRVWFGRTGDYEFRLDEAGQSFEVTLLTAVELGEIRGTVVFSDSPDPLLRATVQLKNVAGTVVATQQSSAVDGSFVFENLNGGTYDVVASRIGYEGASVVGVDVVEGEPTDVGSLLLVLQDPCEPISDLVQVVGDFTGWDEDGPFMTQVTPCVFVDTFEVATPGIKEMKFRTGDAWGIPLDYGSCVSGGPATGLEGDVCPGGASLPNLRIQFPQAGEFEFTLDEFHQRYTIRPLVVVLPGGMEGTVAWSDDPETPPITSVRVVVANTNRVAGQATATGGAWAVDELEAGFYDVEISAPGYVAQKLEDVEVAEGQTTLVPLVTLEALGDCTPSEEVEIVGNWDVYPGEGQAPHMTNLGGCSWADTLTIAASGLPGQTIKFFFRLNEFSGTQVGECENVTLVLESGGTVAAPYCPFQFVNQIEVQVPGDGSYAFTFDEDEQSFSITQVE